MRLSRVLPQAPCMPMMAADRGEQIARTIHNWLESLCDNGRSCFQFLCCIGKGGCACGNTSDTGLGRHRNGTCYASERDFGHCGCSGDLRLNYGNCMGYICSKISQGRSSEGRRRGNEKGGAEYYQPMAYDRRHCDNASSSPNGSTYTSTSKCRRRTRRCDSAERRRPVTTLQQALHVINLYGDRIPVPVDEIISHLGLGPTLVQLPDNISGAIKRNESSPAGYIIVVNSTHHPNRQRFTMAHELGHYIYHRDLLNLGVGDTLAYRAEGSDTPNERIGSLQETEANRFAANLLMPYSLISRIKTQEGIADPAQLAKRFGVSIAAMRIRMGLPFS